MVGLLLFLFEFYGLLFVLLDWFEYSLFCCSLCLFCFVHVVFGFVCIALLC